MSREISMKPQVPEMSEQQIAEIKKVWAICDKDGSGSIDANELKIVMKELAGMEPSPTELDQLLRLIDENNDGIISWEEFLAALGKWLAEENGKGDSSSSSISGKRKEAPTSPMQARVKIHQRISMFFMQFKRESDFNEIRDKFRSLNQGGFHDDISLIFDDMNDSSYEASTDTEKKEKLEEVTEALEYMHEMAAGISSNDPAVALKCVQGVAHVLSICDVFRSPIERYEIGQVMMDVFRRVKEAGVIPRIVQFLTVDDNPELQYESARVITYYAPGPRIAHTPKDSVLHPDKMMHKTEVIHAHAVSFLVDLLNSPCLEVREQSAVALGKIASYNTEARNFVLDYDAAERMYTQIEPGVPLSLLRKLTWSLSILCGQSLPSDADEKYDKVGPALERFGWVIFEVDDEESLLNSICGMGHLLPGIQESSALSRRLCLMLQYPSVRIQSAVLKIFNNMMRLPHASEYVESLLQFELLSNLREILVESRDYSLRLCATEIVALLSGDLGYINEVLKTNLMEALIQLLDDEYAKWKVVGVLSNATRGSAAHVSYLVERLNIISVLGQNITKFKSYDNVLRDVYHFLGPSYNFQFVHDIVDTLMNVLETGEKMNPNPFVDHFGMQLVDQIKTVMMILAEELADEMSSWKSLEDDHRETIEERLTTLLKRIKGVHETYKTPGYQVVVKNINEIMKKFEDALKKSMALLKKKKKGKAALSSYASSSSSSSSASRLSSSRGYMKIDGGKGAMVPLKLVLDQDIRVMEIPRNTTLSELSLQVQLKFNRPCLIQFEDESGDRITIDSKELLAKAFERYEASDEVSMKLFLLARGRGGSGSGIGAGDATSTDVTEAFTSKNKNVKNKLLSELESNTHFSRKDLGQLFGQFQKTSKNGLVDKHQFQKGLKDIGVTDKAAVEQLFSAFDQNKSGTVDFREFVCGLSVMYRGTMEERLMLAFKAYDINGDGVISEDELSNIMRGSLRAQGMTINEEAIQNLVSTCFEKADKDGNGELDFEEFKRAVLNNEIMVQSFWQQQV